MVLRVTTSETRCRLTIFVSLDHVARIMICHDMLWSLIHLIAIGGIGCLCYVLKPVLYHKY